MIRCFLIGRSRVIPSRWRLAVAWMFISFQTVAPAADGDPIAVEVVIFESIARFPQRTAPATVRSLNTPSIDAEIAARVDEIYVRTGDTVAAGARLARLDCRDYEFALVASRARYRALDARVTLAQQKLERARRLGETQMAAEELVDERTAELAERSAERVAQGAQIDLDKTNVTKCEILAPFRALITNRLVSVGDYAMPGQTLIDVVDLGLLEIVADVYAYDATSLPTAKSTFFKWNNQQFPVSFRTAVAAIDSQTRTQDIVFEFIDASALPGASGVIEWQDPRPHLPSKYVVKRDEVLGVFVARGERAEFIVLPGAQVGRDVPAPLTATDQVVSTGYFSLTDGAAISIIQ